MAYPLVLTSWIILMQKESENKIMALRAKDKVYFLGKLNDNFIFGRYRTANMEVIYNSLSYKDSCLICHSPRTFFHSVIEAIRKILVKDDFKL